MLPSVSKTDLDEGWSEVEASAPDDVKSVSEFDENSTGSRGSGDKANPGSPASVEEGPGAPFQGDSVVQVVEAMSEGEEESDEGAESPAVPPLGGQLKGPSAPPPPELVLDGTQTPVSPELGRTNTEVEEAQDEPASHVAASSASHRSSELEDMPLSPMTSPLLAMPQGVAIVPTMSREDIPQTIDEPIVESPRAQNWGWGWGVVTGALKEVSAGVAKDVQELKQSFQAAIRVDSDEELEQEDTGQGALGAEGGEGHPTGAADGVGETPAGLTEEDLRTREVLDRLGQFAEDSSVDTELEKGLKAIDAKMENLTSGLWGLVGKAGSTVGTLAKKVEAATKEVASEVASEFKETMEDVKSLHAVQLASSGIAAAAGTGKRLIENAEKGLGNAMQAFEDDWAGGGQEGAGGGLDATFEQCFYSAGGQEALEEAEELGNESSRICNRGRRFLGEQRRRELDAQIAVFAPLFDISQQKVDVASEGGKGKLPLAQSYASVERVRRHALERARDLSFQALQISERAPSGEALKDEAGHLTTSEEAEAAVAEGRRESLEDALKTVKGEAVHCIAAVCAAGVKHLLQLGTSVGAPLMTGLPDPAFTWPKEASSRATMLRFAVQELENDVNAVAGAFRSAMAEAKESLAAPGGAPAALDEQQQQGSPIKEVSGEQGDEAANKSSSVAVVGSSGTPYGAEIDADEAAAVQRLREAFRSVMYVVLAMMLHDSGETQPLNDDDQEEDDDDDSIAWADDQGQDSDDDDDDDEEEEANEEQIEEVSDAEGIKA